VPLLGAGPADWAAGAGLAAGIEPVVYAGRAEVARHPRSTARGGQVLNLGHYLEWPASPARYPGATALAQARTAGAFTAVHEAFWAAARRAHGEPAGTRGRDRGAPAAPASARRRRDRRARCVKIRATRTDVVAVEARKAGRGGCGDRGQSGIAAGRAAAGSRRSPATTRCCPSRQAR
jgi:hypothetical protein